MIPSASSVHPILVFRHNTQCYEGGMVVSYKRLQFTVCTISFGLVLVGFTAPQHKKGYSTPTVCVCVC